MVAPRPEWTLPDGGRSEDVPEKRKEAITKYNRLIPSEGWGGDENVSMETEDQNLPLKTQPRREPQGEKACKKRPQTTDISPARGWRRGVQSLPRIAVFSRP